MYACALVLWELASRCKMTGEDFQVFEYNNSNVNTFSISEKLHLPTWKHLEKQTFAFIKIVSTCRREVYFGLKKKYEQCKSSWPKTTTYAFTCKVDYKREQTMPKLHLNPICLSVTIASKLRCGSSRCHYCHFCCWSVLHFSLQHGSYPLKWIQITLSLSALRSTLATCALLLS